MSRDPIAVYLSSDTVPDFLKPVSAMPMYSSVDVAAQNHTQDDKYQQYFTTLSLNPIDSFSEDGRYQPSVVDSMYMDKHQVWRPNVQTCRSSTSTTETSFKSMFSAFINIPTVFSDNPLTGLSFYSGVEMPDGIHIYGGLKALENDEYIKKLKLITKDFTIPPENIKLLFDYDLPLPFEKEKFASIAHTPFPYHAKYDPGCNSLQVLMDLRKYDDHLSESNSTSSSEYNGLSGMRVPKALCCASAAKLSDRFYVLYGGIDLVEEIRHPDDSHCIIEKKIIVNDQFWVFDCLSLKYKEIKLIVHPAFASVFTDSIPRFGHCMEAVPIEKTNNSKHIVIDKNSKVKKANPSATEATLTDSSTISEYNRSEINKTPTTPTTHASSSNNGYSPQEVLDELKRNHRWYSNRKHSNGRASAHFEKPAILFAMGGYTSKDKDSRSFVAVNDLWKCEVFLDDFGVSDEIFCCPIGSFDLLQKNSFIINQKGESLPNISTNDIFPGLFHHSESNGAQWPMPRGFFAMNLIDKKEIGQYFLDHGDVSNDSPQKKPLDIISPTPSKASFTHFNESRPKSSVLNGNNVFTPLVGSPRSLKSPSSIRQTYFNARNENHSPSTSSIENNSDRGTSTSSFSELGIHTSQIPQLNSKILIIHGGSSIMYTKVVDEETGEETTFYNKRIVGDCWWFDFQAEKWNKYQTLYENATMNLNICGHLMVPSEEYITVFGGLQERHYDDSEFDVIVHELPTPDSKLDPNIYKVAQDFTTKVRVNQHGREDQTTEEFQRSAGLSHEFPNGRQYIPGAAQCYTSYILDIPNNTWKIVDYAYVRDILLTKIWESGDEINSGGVCKSNAQYFDKLEDSPYYMVYTVSFIGIYDSKVIVMINDVHLINKKTDKRSELRQGIWANGITEIYSSFLSI